MFIVNSVQFMFCFEVFCLSMRVYEHRVMVALTVVEVCRRDLDAHLVLQTANSNKVV